MLRARSAPGKLAAAYLSNAEGSIELCGIHRPEFWWPLKGYVQITKLHGAFGNNGIFSALFEEAGAQ